MRVKRGLAMFCGLVIAVAGHAQESPAPFADFEAKRVRPPTPGTHKRITVQIDPQASPSSQGTSDVEAAEDGSIEVPKPSARYEWFWAEVGSDLAGASPGRLQDGLAVLETRSDISTPRLQDLQNMIAAYGVQMLTSTIGTEVSPALVLAVMAVESGGKPDAISRVGAQGLMQLMPDTATQYGVVDAFDPQQNIAGGVKFLNQLASDFSGDPILVLAGYNAGAGAVREHGGVPPFAETRDYVPKVLAAYRIARNLCTTPPIMISDGCVFEAMK
ncbi:lytic transglycosylase domain-containing protein [Tritonibacter sp. AK171]|uniref:lytic transglycosylase domain-containing protein n=1 Tax=Tritonibacter sp. AK171 TaxID=3048493 RepID=UPI0024C415DA|nr:lytic transglycosylase domain-containing protein [Tritonibacter sp. AK171]